MARRSKAALVVQAKVTPAPRGLDPRLERLAGRYTEIRSQAYHYMVDSSRDAGVVLDEARKVLTDPRDFNRWTEALGVSRGTVTNFINVARMARHSPGLYDRWRSLGPSKMYRVARLVPAAREAVLATPGIAEMNDAVFARLCSPLETVPVAVTGNMRGNGLVQKARGMSDKLDRWKLPKITSKAVRDNLKQGLLELARKARALAGKL
jgi:hypothetical protein